MFFGTGCAGLAAGAGKAFCWFAPSNGECGTNVVSKLVRLASIASPGNACGCWARVAGMELELGDGVLKSLWVPLSITLAEWKETHGLQLHQAKHILLSRCQRFPSRANGDHSWFIILAIHLRNPLASQFHRVGWILGHPWHCSWSGTSKNCAKFIGQPLSCIWPWLWLTTFVDQKVQNH